MKTSASVLAQLRRNVNLGKIGCIDMSLPPESYLLGAKKFKLIFEVVDFVLRNERNRFGSYLVSMPYRLARDKIFLRRTLDNLVILIRHIQKRTGLPMIFDVARLPGFLWDEVLRKVRAKRIFVVRDPDKSLRDYVGELYYFFQRAETPDLRLNPNDPVTVVHEKLKERERRLSGGFCDVRKILGNDTIILIHEKSISQASCEDHGEDTDGHMILYPNRFLTDTEAIERWHRRIEEHTGNGPNNRGTQLKKAS